MYIPGILFVGRHHDVGTVGGGGQHVEVPVGLQEGGEVRLTAHLKSISHRLAA